MTIHGSQQGCADLSDAGASSDGRVGRCTEPAEDLTMAPARLDDTHRQLRDDEFWRAIPAYADLTAAEFHDHRFQSRNCVTSIRKLRDVLGPRVSDAFCADAEAGTMHSTMSVRISPYILSLIDWDAPETDPLRTQFLPLASRLRPDHPELALDSLNEQGDSPVEGLTHRYHDRALFLALDTCPVYCRFCTRSYSVGLDTEDVEKVHFGASSDRWERIFDYIRAHEELEDIVVSGGDMYNLRAEQITYLGNTLLDIDHIRRFRFATKGPAVMPQKLLTDHDWLRAVTGVVEEGRRRHKLVAVHTHFNHPNEITQVTHQALNRLVEAGVTIRNQSVLQRGVNDDVQVMRCLVRRLGYVSVQPYYVFVHDMVRGVEELRTSLQTAIHLEKQVRGATAGYHMPTFILDTMGGGGKRHVHGHEHYDRTTGVAVFDSPVVRPGQQFLYLDPIDELSPQVQQRWADADARRQMIDAALAIARRPDRSA
jgi:lysine 2,3-aminomutase